MVRKKKTVWCGEEKKGCVVWWGEEEEDCMG